MKNKLISLVLALLMIISLSAFTASAEASLTISAEFEFTDAGEYLVVNGITSEKYNQAMSIVVYDPAFTNGVEDLRGEDGKISENPSEMKPLADAENIIRMGKVRADADGNFSISFTIDGIEDGQYLIVRATGAGKNSVSASVLRQYYTEDTLLNVTLPAFENATEDELEELLRQNQLFLGIELGDDYRANKDKIHSMFVSIRNKDCKVDAETGRKFNSMQDVADVLKSVEALRSLPLEVTEDDAESFVQKYESMIGYDFSEENEHYMLSKNKMYEIVANILNENFPESMSDVKTAVTQAVALVMLNSKDGTTIGSVVEKYATILGLDTGDYAIYCQKYTDYEVNKAFVEKNFKMPSEVLNSLKKRIAELENKKKPSGGGGGGGGGSSSDNTDREPLNNSTMNNILGVNDALISSDKDKDIQQGTYFTDITDSHWAYSSVKKLSSKNIIAGYPDGTFLPDAVVTREQFVKIIVTAFELESDSLIAFSDVSNDRWSADFIKTAAALNIVNGMGDGTFLPNAGVTRQDAAVMIARLCEKKGIELTGKGNVADSDEISGYALESVEKLVDAGIISGFEDGTFRPAKMLTRAQAAKLISELIEK